MMAVLNGLGIPRIAEKIMGYIRHFPECIRNKTATQRPFGELQPLQSKAHPFHTLAVDFMVGMLIKKSKIVLQLARPRDVNMPLL
jgi:hypothetical protein